MDADLIVIGSGFGGAVVAHRAAAAGMRVVVLERGGRMDGTAWRRAARGQAPLVQWTMGRRERRHIAPVEIRTIPGLTAVVGAALGGGSEHYTSVTVPARGEAFSQGWPADWTAESMRPYYARVAERLKPGVVPRAFAQTVALERAASAMNVRSERLPLAIRWEGDGAINRGAADCGWRGELVRWMRSPAGEKNTLEQAYLNAAEHDGAAIRTRHVATRIGEMRDAYRVEFVQHAGGESQRGYVDAPRVVLAAGTIHSVRLLLEARDVHGSLPRLSAALGKRYSGNGDYGALLVGPKAPAFERDAPSATAWIDHWETDRMFLMDLGRLPVFGDGIGRYLRPLLRVRDGSSAGAAGAVWMIGGYGLGGGGTLQLRRDGVMAHLATRSEEIGFDGQLVQRLRDLARATGATLLRLPISLTRRHSFTVHPMGGCTLADSPEQGVCDPTGQVYGHAGLFVADGSVLPAPLGVPPSMTIAAAAERIANGVVKS